MSFQRSKEDHVMHISKSIFVTNFPDNYEARDLWKVCEGYGKVVDVFIPNHKSKAGKRFAFVWFVRVEDIDRLVGNLCTIWIGRLHLHANVVRYERPSRTYNSAGYRQTKVHVSAGSYVTVVKGNSPSYVPVTSHSSSPALMLDDSCVIERNLSKHAMGRVKDINSIPNLRSLLMDEGFPDVKLMYIGVLQDTVHDFVSDEHIVWVDIEGIPLNVWSRETFLRIGKKWGETMDIEDNFDSSFGRKRLCIRTKHADSILEKFKIIFRGKVFMVRAKELFTWNPTFLYHKETEYSSDDESVHDTIKKPIHSQHSEEDSDDDSDVEGVSETIFGDNSSLPNNCSGGMEEQKSKDPFSIYELLKKHQLDGARDSSPSLSRPPGFTPEVSEIQKDNVHVEGDIDSEVVKEFSPMVNAKVMNNSQEVQEESNRESTCQNVGNNGGSVLGVLEDMIRVRQAMGYTMDGCIKDLDHIIASSGGILCVWEASVFKKDYVKISDNFIAIYGTWLPSNSKILFVAIYAPQQASLKRVLWDYFSILLGRWNGEAIIMGDFNEVRFEDERRGSVFNPSSARNFNHFISSSGLVDVKLEGYAFTWSHPLASKISKLDRFLVSEGILSLFPSITSICLDRHLSDHRPILLCEVHTDFGPIPFRFYHSWFSLDGFDDMVEHAWNSFSHSDANGMIRFKKKSSIKNELGVIDKDLDRGVVSDTNLHRRLELKLADLERSVSRAEIRMAAWNCGENKSPVEYFFENGSFPKGCNSSFIALTPKVTDAKFVTDFRPISLIGCIYKVVTKILANRLALVISDLVSDTQSAFVANRQILDGPFILNEAFGLDQNWCKWVRGTFRSAMTSVLVNGSPSTEFPFYCGLKQGDPLSPYLFILIMESLHMSFSRAANEGLFKVFFLASGLKINIHKSQVFGVGITRSLVMQAAASIGCAAMQSQFRYLGVMVGECMSRHKAWTDTVLKLRSRLCNWKVKTLSIGGRLTLLKSVPGASPLYNMSIYKVPRGVLKSMETIRSKFFNGADYLDKKITWAAWGKVLASKKNGGLGVSSFHALNRALLLKWVWRFISQDGSLWFRVIQVLYGPSIDSHPVNLASNCCSIVRELNLLKDKGFPRMFALEMEKEVSVAVKMRASVVDSFCRTVRNGTGRHQMLEVRNILDDLFLPAHLNSTRWVKYIPIKINVFAWRARRDCLPTRSNLIRRSVPLVYANCPLCQTSGEDIQHVLFRCDLAQIVLRKICRWWDLDWQDLSSFSDWHSWFSSIRLPINVKSVLEGVFCVAWWVIWVLQNRTIFVETPPRCSVIFDDIVSYSFNWCSSRCNRVFSWETWLKTLI
uniref:RNA-directed DNA polymerase, eukaryota n=1 Tax=Tanacetum cinerariifolium TaxID=118510 RepID=A0A699HUP0_TANCI|nr:RNA-directed DNA polymerase, eukaryota [Tanacetum cinerariifolium]